MTRLYNLGILNYPLETLNFFISVLEWARSRKWAPLDFVSYAMRNHNEIQLYGMYMRGEISFEEFKRRIAPYVQG